MSEATKEPPYVDPFYAERAKCLKLLDNSVKMCKANHLSPGIEQLEEAVRIGYELLEELHRNSVQERLCDLMEKAMALIQRKKEEI